MIHKCNTVECTWSAACLIMTQLTGVIVATAKNYTTFQQKDGVINPTGNVTHMFIIECRQFTSLTDLLFFNTSQTELAMCHVTPAKHHTRYIIPDFSNF